MTTKEGDLKPLSRPVQKYVNAEWTAAGGEPRPEHLQLWGRTKSWMRGRLREEFGEQLSIDHHLKRWVYENSLERGMARPGVHQDTQIAVVLNGRIQTIDVEPFTTSLLRVKTDGELTMDVVTFFQSSALLFNESKERG